MSTRPSNIKRALYIIIPLILVALTVIKLFNNKQTAQQLVYHHDIDKPISILADTVQSRNLSVELLFPGSFEPNKETRLSADIQGKVDKIFVDVGDTITKGKTLIQLDNTLLKLQLQTIEVQIEGLEADVRRYTVLAKADAVQGVQLEKSTLGLKSAKVQRETVLEQINKTTIKAPFSGIVTAKLTELGAFAGPGVPLLQITDISKLKFTINVPDVDLNTFASNNSFSISVDIYPDIKLEGDISLIGSKANMGNSFPIQFTLNNTANLNIKAGMFGKAHVQNVVSENAISVPTSILIGSTQKPQIYLIKNGKAVLHSVTISKIVGENAIISSGLKEGDIFVKQGFANLFNNANVTVN